MCLTFRFTNLPFRQTRTITKIFVALQMGDIGGLFKPEDLETAADISRACQLLDEKEVELDTELEEILSRQCQLNAKMSSIGAALEKLTVVESNSKKLYEMITHTSQLAETVSAKVRRLDEARSRVSECQQRVHDLIDLQLCSQGVIASIKEEDYEKGATHVNRFLSMDQNLLQRTADDVSGSITSVSEAVQTLEEATIQIRTIVTEKFNEAVRKDDLASVERFFKVFALLGMHDDGILKFSNYICSKLQVKAQKELRASMDTAKAEKRTTVAFADTLTIMFENIARVIEVNQPIIELYYGSGYLLGMVKVLQSECDQEVKKLVLEFNKMRQLQRRKAQINDYIKSGSGSSTLGHFRKSSNGSMDKLNPKDIDALLAELTIIHSRAELYTRFVKRRVAMDIESSSASEETKLSKVKELEQLLDKSDLNRQMQELLGTYLLFERYFMEESVLKAIQLDSTDTSQYLSSMVDDVFFIIRKSIRRSIKTQSLDGICAVINNGASCFESDFINALKIPLKAGYPTGYIDLAQAYNALQTSLQAGKLQTSDTEQGRTNFIVQLNNADKCTEYVETLWLAMRDEIQAAHPALNSREKEKLESCLAGLKSVSDSMKAVVDFGVQQLRSSAVKPRLHPWVDQFLTHNHQPTEDELATYEAGETFVQFLIMQIDGLLKSFQSILSARNYDALVSILATDVTARLERAIKKSIFNRLGGLILDQEIRALGSYLASSTSWSVRDKFARLTQMATLLNLEKVFELAEYWNPADNSWRLTPNEARTVLALRSDFRMEDIKRLKL